MFFLDKQTKPVVPIFHSPFQTSDCCNFYWAVVRGLGHILDISSAEVLDVVTHSFLPCGRLVKSCQWTSAAQSHLQCTFFTQTQCRWQFQFRCLKSDLCMGVSAISVHSPLLLCGRAGSTNHTPLQQDYHKTSANTFGMSSGEAGLFTVS